MVEQFINKETVKKYFDKIQDEFKTCINNFSLKEDSEYINIIDLREKYFKKYHDTNFIFFLTRKEINENIFICSDFIRDSNVLIFHY